MVETIKKNMGMKSLSKLRFDCLSYKGHKPCEFHKLNNTTCNNKCEYYSPIKTKILIIKLDAMGDVLRTTSILPALKRKYRSCHITWITRKESFYLLVNNPYLDRILEYDIDAMSRLVIECFDIVINPSNDASSAAIAQLARGKLKYGFGLDGLGAIIPFNEAAEYFLRLGIDDNLKKTNKKTYQQLIFEMLDLEYKKIRPILRLSPEEIRLSKSFAGLHCIKEDDLVFGLNTGAGERWQLKAWGIEQTAQLAERMCLELGAKVILFGGSKELERNRSILSQCSEPLINAGCDNEIRNFAALVNLVDILVTSDSLALHIGTALQKRVIALFGPTSHEEIELYDRGNKLFAEIDCLCCYMERCAKRPSCMDYISVEHVLKSIRGAGKYKKRRQQLPANVLFGESQSSE